MVSAVVYSKHDCVVCDKAKTVLATHGIAFDVFYVDDDAERMADCCDAGIGLDQIPAIRVYNDSVEVRRWLADDILAGLTGRVVSAVADGWTYQDWKTECPKIERREDGLLPGAMAGPRPKPKE